MVKTERKCENCLHIQIDFARNIGYCFEKHMNVNNLQGTCADWKNGRGWQKQMRREWHADMMLMSLHREQRQRPHFEGDTK